MANHLLILAQTSKLRLWAIAGLLALLVVYPLVYADPYYLHLMILWLIWSMMTVAWAALLGFLGIFHFAQIAFFGLGSYASSILSLEHGLSPWLSIAVGGLVAGVFSLGLSLPSLRLKGPYIAVVSLGFSECIRITISNLEFTKAELGIWGVPPLWAGCTKTGVYYSVLLACALVVALFFTVLTSKQGLAIKAVKASSDSAESVGIEIYRTKISFFFICSFIAGIAGGFYVHYLNGVSPEIFNIANMIDVMVMGILGGLSSVFGPLIGVFVVMFSLECLRAIHDLRFMVYAVVIIVLIIFKPQGIYDYIDRLFHRLEKRLVPLRKQIHI